MPHVKPATVLVADSHEHYRRGLVRAVASHPELALVGVAHNGERALTLIRKARPDVALLDVRLPRLDGFAVCERLQDDVSASRTRLVLLAAVPDEGQAMRTASIGAAACWSKDASRDEILRALIVIARGDRSPSADGAADTD